MLRNKVFFANICSEGVGIQPCEDEVFIKHFTDSVTNG
jgi:hypothetical protein